jgi:hypothetical protein
MVKRPPHARAKPSDSLPHVRAPKCLCRSAYAPLRFNMLCITPLLDHVDSSIRTWNMRRHDTSAHCDDGGLSVSYDDSDQSDSLDSVSWQFIKSASCQGLTGTRGGEINLSRTMLHYMVSHGNPTPKNSAMQIGGKVKSVRREEKKKKSRNQAKRGEQKGHDKEKRYPGP